MDGTGLRVCLSLPRFLGSGLTAFLVSRPTFGFSAVVLQGILPAHQAKHVKTGGAEIRKHDLAVRKSSASHRRNAFLARKIGKRATL